MSWAGLAIPTGQIVPPGFGGYDANLAVPRYDPEQAKKLLAEAGDPNGFGLTVTCTNDRYPNDDKVCQAVGQMLARIGLKMKVTTMPRSVFFGKAIDPKGERFSLGMLGWGSQSSGEADALMQALHSYDPPKGLGTWNFGHYSNPQVDALIEKAENTLDDTARFKLEAEAMKMAMDDAAMIPLYTQTVAAATRKGLHFTVYASEWTPATAITPEAK